MSRYIKKAVKRLVIERSGGRCEYCKSPRSFTTELFCLDHIIPISEGGSNEADNLAYCCNGCNTFKSDLTTVTITTNDKIIAIPLFNPRMQNWSLSFNWNKDYTEIIGITAIGRATVDTLRLNRTSLKNLRRVLVIVGEHPPQ